jgi:hypothetical protein
MFLNAKPSSCPMNLLLAETAKAILKINGPLIDFDLMPSKYERYAFRLLPGDFPRGRHLSGRR